MVLGQPSAAQLLLEHIRNLLQDLPNLPGLVHYYFKVAKVYQRINCKPQARQTLVVCPELRRASSAESLAASKACIELSKLLGEEGASEEALKFALKAMNILTKECQPSEEYMKLLNKGIELSNSYHRLVERKHRTPHAPRAISTLRHKPYARPWQTLAAPQQPVRKSVEPLLTVTSKGLERHTKNRVVSKTPVVPKDPLLITLPSPPRLLRKGNSSRFKNQRFSRKLN